jgi:hypothetical protein
MRPVVAGPFRVEEEEDWWNSGSSIVVSRNKNKVSCFKGTVARDFLASIFFMDLPFSLEIWAPFRVDP